ncbi:Hypersensitive-induced reaction 1 protein (CaHIR1) (LRR1-interacting protein 3) (CaLRRIP3) [Durusdinium trenchii]|uniref:Hypersensitive-induced reaction 1 protein (CaHIR1) (LRR1-interacting protein 3) (CaLRRIP3) n=1 Tax=Durusdinium trenchii TaxID=1381693 RepID=A0ABP0MPT0_9DINO
MVGEPQARGRDDFNKHGEKRDGTGGLGNVIFKAATLLAEFYVFMEVLLRRRALCAALVLVLRLGGFHSGFAVGSTYKITFLCPFCHTVKFKRKTLKVHTGTIDGVWSLLKKALPKQIRTTDVTDKTKINQKIWRHARAWQWRWEHAKHDSLATLTAKTLRGMYSVIPSKAKEAIYKLVQQELGGMLRSFLIGPIRAYLNKHTLEEVFGKKDEISLSIREQLTDYLKSYGFAVHSLEMTELTVSPEVMHALNEAQKQRRNCDTARVDMAKLRVEKVREAEAEALSAELYGRRLSEECQQLILQAASDEALCSSFEGARREQAIEETHAQHLPEQLDAEMLTSLLREIDEEGASLLTGSQAAGLVLGKAGPSQHSMS